jgi:hypothetical protein
MNSSPNEFTQSTESAKSAQPLPNQGSENHEPSSVSANQSSNNEGTEQEATSAVSDQVNPKTNPQNIGDTEESSEESSAEIEGMMRQHPIPPPSEPRQYRAIGLVNGHYRASQEQFTKGMLVTPDGTEIDAVLLGRVMSLVKNHINLEENHLWVVYPRTRQNNGQLHLQIVGIWEPEQLGPHNKATADSELNQAGQPDPASPSVSTNVESKVESSEYRPVADGYFSIRGEVVYQSESEEDDAYIIIKIKQHPRKPSDTPKFFKLKLTGTLNGKAVGHFWDLHLQRQGQTLAIEEKNDLGIVGPTKRKDLNKYGGGGGRTRGDKRFSGNKSLQRPGKKPYKSSASVRSGPVPKPTIKKLAKPEE